MKSLFRNFVVANIASGASLFDLIDWSLIRPTTNICLLHLRNKRQRDWQINATETFILQQVHPKTPLTMSMVALWSHRNSLILLHRPGPDYNDVIYRKCALLTIAQTFSSSNESKFLKQAALKKCMNTFSTPLFSMKNV